MTWTDEDWAAAEAIVLAHATRVYGAPPAWIQRPSPALPGLFTAKGFRAVVVLHGKVFDETGLAALGVYLRAIDFLAARTVDLGAILFLLFALRAFPPVAAPLTEQGYLFDPEAKHPLHPRLDWSDDAARLVLSYVLPGSPMRHDGGSPSEPQPFDVSEWTLRIDRSYAPVWSERRYERPR